jgi:hypothetical protein
LKVLEAEAERCGLESIPHPLVNQTQRDAAPGLGGTCDLSGKRVNQDLPIFAKRQVGFSNYSMPAVRGRLTV